MPKGLVAICQFGGVFMPNNDGSMLYSGGEAYAIPVNHSMTFDDFKSELSDNLNQDISTFSIKYFLPNNKRTLITISNDKGLQRMIDFYEDLDTVDIYILSGETIIQSVSNKVEQRSKRTENRSAARVTKVTPRTPSRYSARIRNRTLLATNTSLNDVGPPLDAIIVGKVEQPGSIISSECGIVGVGQEFNTAHELRTALRKYAIARGFVLQYVKNDSARITVKCKADGCPWRVHASRLSSMQKFKLKKINDDHNCSGGVGQDGHPQATEQWIASIIKEKLRDNPQYKPRDIADDILRDYGIKLKYQKVWRGKEVAMEQLQALRVDSYHQLPWYCDKLRETNPGSSVTLVTTEEQRFLRLFVSFHAAQHGFENGCRPLLFLNALSLREKHPGLLLVASSVDAEDGVFPVAFAIVEAENNSSWCWFLAELKSTFSITRTITFISDRNNGLDNAVVEVFESSYHAFSLSHLIEDFKMQLTGLYSHHVKEAMIEEFKRAAFTCKIDDFNDCVGTMRNVSHDVAAWVLSSKCDHWSNAFFKGLRYNYYSSSFVESIYHGWIPEENELSIIKLVDTICCKMMELINARREASSMWSTTLTPSPEEKIQIALFNSRPFNVLVSSDTVYEVRDNSVNIVNIDTWDCTCRQWRISGLPCIHAVAVLDRTGRNIYDYCSGCFMVESYRATYFKSINLVPDATNPLPDGFTPSIIVNPPLRRVRGPPGRPKQKRTESVVRKRLRLRFCSRCKEAGHNKKTCHVLLLQQ